MPCVMRLNQNQNESINSILYRCNLLGKMFCDIHCFMVSICDAESHFNDSAKEKYHLLIHYKKLSKSKNI